LLSRLGKKKNVFGALAHRGGGGACYFCKLTGGSQQDFSSHLLDFSHDLSNFVVVQDTRVVDQLIFLIYKTSPTTTPDS
jgi:hypothetical protein